MPDGTPLELTQEQYTPKHRQPLSGVRPPDGELLAFTIRLTPRAAGGFHLSMSTFNWFTDSFDASFDSIVDSIGVAADCIDGYLGEYHRRRNESDSEPP